MRSSRLQYLCVFHNVTIMEIRRKRLDFSLNTQVEEQLKRLKNKLKISMSEIVRRAIEDFEKKVGKE